MSVLPATYSSIRGTGIPDDLRPHDLLRVSGAEALADGPTVPDWVRSSLVNAPFVVLRRASRRGHLLPVGIRGASRGERFAAFISIDAILDRISPEQLARN